MLEDYVKDAKEVSSEDILLESYDHERATVEQSYLDGLDKGKDEKQIEIIKSLYQNGATIDIIAKSAGISIEEVQEILGINN